MTANALELAQQQLLEPGGLDQAQLEMVLSHLMGLAGAKGEIKLEIQVEAKLGIPDNVIRTVTENCRTLKFDANEFESE